jgi:hypothetical protein
MGKKNAEDSTERIYGCDKKSYAAYLRNVIGFPKSFVDACINDSYKVNRSQSINPETSSLIKRVASSKSRASLD